MSVDFAVEQDLSLPHPEQLDDAVLAVGQRKRRATAWSTFLYNASSNSP